MVQQWTCEFKSRFLFSTLTASVTGNTPDFGSGDWRFEPFAVNMKHEHVKLKHGDGIVVAYNDRTPGGPIVTGSTEEEALAKYDNAMVLYRVITAVMVLEDRMN